MCQYASTIIRHIEYSIINNSSNKKGIGFCEENNDTGELK